MYRVSEPGRLGNDVLDALVQISVRGFGSEMDPDDVKDHVQGTDMLHLMTDQSGLIGFAAYTMAITATFGGKSGILYLGGTVLDVNKQGKGFFSLSARSAIEETTPYAMVLRTQNPAMMAAVRNVVLRGGLGRVFPELDAEPAHEAVMAGAAIAEMLGQEDYDPRTMVGRGTYGKAINGIDRLDSVDAKTREIFLRLGLDRNRGDSVMVVAMLENADC